MEDKIEVSLTLKFDGGYTTTIDTTMTREALDALYWAEVPSTALICAVSEKLKVEVVPDARF